MSRPVKMAHDGLPEPLPVRPVLNPFALVLGALFGLAVTVLLQQAGRIVASTLFLILGAILGILIGILLPTVPYLFAARNANNRLAAERTRRASLVVASREVTP